MLYHQQQQNMTAIAQRPAILDSIDCPPDAVSVYPQQHSNLHFMNPGDVALEFGEDTVDQPLSAVAIRSNLNHVSPINERNNNNNYPLNEDFAEPINSNDPDDRDYSASPLNSNYTKRDLKIECKFGSKGDKDGQFNMPHGFCFGENDSIVIADTQNHRISVSDLKGNFLYSFGKRGINIGELYLPRKVCLVVL